MMTLYRAIAYQLQPLDTYEDEVQPECCVFFEAHTPETAPITLVRMLALAWGCTPADVGFYNLHSEHELLRDGAEEAPGEASLWVSGNYHGPLFHRTERTLMFVRPITLARLIDARSQTMQFRTVQRLAAQAWELQLEQARRKRDSLFGSVVRALGGPPQAGA